MAKKKDPQPKPAEPDLNATAKMSDEFLEAPPADYQDPEDSFEVKSSKDALLVGKILAKLDKTEIDTIYKVLAPLSKKMGWYAQRYWAMQEKIRYYKSEYLRVLKKCMQYEERFNISAEARETGPEKPDA